MTGHDLTHDAPMTDAQSRAELHADFATSITVALFDHLTDQVGAGRMALTDAYKKFTLQADALHDLTDKGTTNDRA